MDNPHGDPKTVEELVCWLNCWGDEDKHSLVHDKRWRDGYEQAISDAMKAVEPLAPNWINTWRRARVA